MSPAPEADRKARHVRCREIADQVVPEYRTGRYPCHGTYAKRWGAAWQGACLALGGSPDEYQAPLHLVDLEGGPPVVLA